MSLVSPVVGFLRICVEVFQVGVVVHPADQVEPCPADRIDAGLFGEPSIGNGNAGELRELFAVLGETARVYLTK